MSQDYILTFQGASEGTEKWGVKTQKWGGKNQISAKICLLLTDFAPFFGKSGGEIDPPAPLLPKALNEDISKFSEI